MILYPTREQWLDAAATELLKLFPAGTTLPPIKLSVGWPKGRGSKSHRRIGECWCKTSALDGQTHSIFISPELVDPVAVLATLLHELIHAVVGIKAGHRKPFSRLAASVGLEKPWTAARPSEGLLVRLGEVADVLGEYPHVGLTLTVKERKPQRNRPWQCPCGKKVRAAAGLRAKCLDCHGVFRENEALR